MPKYIAYIDEPAPRERHRDAVPTNLDAPVVFAQARIPAIDADAQKVFIGTPADEVEGSGSMPKCHEHWQTVRDKYEAEKQYRDSDVSPQMEVIVLPGMDPNLGGPEDALVDLVGKKGAEALHDAGYGTVQAAKALDEGVKEYAGIGQAKYEKLHPEAAESEDAD